MVDHPLPPDGPGEGLSPVADRCRFFESLSAGERKHPFAQRGQQDVRLKTEAAVHHCDCVGIARFIGGSSARTRSNAELGGRAFGGISRCDEASTESCGASSQRYDRLDCLDHQIGHGP